MCEFNLIDLRIASLLAVLVSATACGLSRAAPLVVATSAAATRLAESPQPAEHELWAATWRPVPSDCTLLTPMLFLEGSFTPGRTNTPANPRDFARRSLQLPTGRVAVLWWRYSNSLFATEADSARVGGLPSKTIPTPWATIAAPAVREEWRTWLRDFKAAGGRMDYLVGDDEQWGAFKNWNLTQSEVMALANDPRAAEPRYGAAPLRALLKGVRIDMVTKFSESDDYLLWNKAVGTLAAAAMNFAIWQPALAAFPKLRGSNFEGVRTTEHPGPNSNGHAQPDDNIFGTNAAPAQYGANRGAAQAWFIDPTHPTKLSKHGSNRIALSPWFAFLLDMQQGRACRRSAPKVGLNPWIAPSSWRNAPSGDVAYPDDPRYWEEMVRHYALLGSEMFNFWNPTSIESGTTQIHLAAQQRDEDARRLNRVLLELNRRTLGPVVAQASVAPLSFRAQLLTTGAQRRDGTWLWRTTVEPGTTALRDRRSGTVVTLESHSIGRWDQTSTALGPDYECVAAPAALKPLPNSVLTPQ